MIFFGIACKFVSIGKRNNNQSIRLSQNYSLKINSQNEACLIEFKCNN